MAKLSKESAEWHYEKLIALHYFDYLTPAQKVSIFYHDLEHDILKEITGKKEYFEQYNWLKDNQIRFERNIKTGDIPKVNIGDIENLKNWRNEGIHENKMPEPKYKNHLHTMAQTICFFSEVPIPNELNNIFNNQNRKNNLNKNINTNKLNNNSKSGLKRTELFKIFKEKLSVNINHSNTIYSNINIPTQVWWFELDNTKIKNGFNLVLIDQFKNIMYYFVINNNSIKEPKNVFYQRNDKRKKNTSSIQIRATDTDNFLDIKSNEQNFVFKNYLVKTIKYEKNV